VKEVSCETKGSYCLCHYCKCEKGRVHCGKPDLQFGYGREEGPVMPAVQMYKCKWSEDFKNYSQAEVTSRVGENPVFKKNQPSGFFLVFLVFLVFLGYLFFFVFFVFFCPHERVFRVFSVSRILKGVSRL
jgi:hypothetical protein